MFRINSLIVLLLLVVSLGAQQHVPNKKAFKLFEQGRTSFDGMNYESAIYLFDQAILKDPLYCDPHMMKGMAYVEQRFYKKAIASYERVISIDPYFFPNIYEELGGLYMKQGDYEKAANHLETFVRKFNPEPKMRARANLLLDNCLFAMESMKTPVDFEVENLGPTVNSPYHDFSPFMTPDDEFLYFSRTIPDERAVDGQHEDFYMSKVTKDGFLEARNVGMPINSLVNEGAIAISPDGQFMIFTICDRFGNYGNERQGVGTCDLFIAKKQGNRWSRARNLGATVNSPKWDGQPCLASDGKTLYFASKRLGGRGKSDIFYSKIGKDGWSKPQSVGSIINTPGTEMGVFIHPDNQTLYFTSDGHVGMGGFDLYMSRRNDNGSWGKPVNLGYPINTEKDEMSLFVDARGRLAYINSDREGGYGSEDIYRFPIPKSIAPYPTTFMKGLVYDKETKDYLGASFELIDVETGNVVVESQSNAEDGEFIVCLPLGKNYALHVSKDGYLFYSEKFELSTGSYDKPFAMDVPMTPVKENVDVVLNNVFFDVDKFDVLAKSEAELDKLVEFLSNNKGLTIELSGHTDNQGSEAHNLELSLSRANSVKSYIVAKGIEETRIQTKGYGSSKPVASNDTKEGRAKNRRTVFKIVALK